jgi:hypothetical protein
MAYFRQIYGQASPERAYQVESLHYAYSWDGAHWITINHNQPVYIPEIDGQPANIRDPFLARGPEGDFHLLSTEGTYGGCSKSLLYARSHDLVHWEGARRLPVMESAPEAKNAWAPEFIYDPVQKDYFVFWSSTLAEKVWAGKHIWYTRTRDFQTFAPPRPLFDPGLNIIDAHIVPAAGKFYLFFKPDSDNATKYVRVAAADQLEGPYQILTEGVTPAVSEGPHVMRGSRPDLWYLFYDLAYTNAYGLSVSQDLIHWEIVHSLHFPEDTRHGSFLSISEDELALLLWQYDFRFLVETTGRATLDMAGTLPRESEVSTRI